MENNSGISDRSGPVPSVDPADMKKMYDFGRQLGPHPTGYGVFVAAFPEADVLAIIYRSQIISFMQWVNLLGPWQHGEELDDKVFQVAATFPLKFIKEGAPYEGYTFEVDGVVHKDFPIDAEGVLQKLRE